VLDQLDLFSATRLKRSTTAPIVLNDLNSTGATNLRSCQSGRNGMTCLDVQMVRQWKVPKVLPATPPTDDGLKLFSCQDDALALAADGCTSLTVDVAGDIWLSARKTSSSTNVYEVKRNRNTNGTCPTDGGAGIALVGKIKGQTIANTDSTSYCAYTRRTGQPALLDISAFDGQLSTRWAGGRGILGVADKKSVLFYPSSGGAIIALGSGKTDWSLVGNEQVLSATLLQREVANPSPPSTVYTYVVITTDTGRALWRRVQTTMVPAKLLANLNATGTETASPSIDPVTGIVSFPQGTLCETGTTLNTFAIRSSDTTGRLFFTNRNYCKLLVSSPVYSGADILTGTGNQKYSTTSTFKPEGVSVSPGIAVDLTKCAPGGPGCGVLPNGDPNVNQFDAAKMTSVTLAPNSPSGLLAFQIRNIPDCRDMQVGPPPDCDKNNDQVVDSGLIVPGPRGDYLNVTPLLPQQIKDLFDTSGVAPKGLPPLYISPRYHAQSAQGHRFEALFGITDPNTQFRKEFTLTLDIGDPNLAGQKLGCGMFDKDPNSPSPPEPDVFNLWDIVTVVSERFATIGGPTDTVTGAGPDHVDILANTDCFNPTPTGGSRWSMYSYNLELAEDPSRGFLYSDGVRYLGELLKQLLLDLRATQNRQACANVDFVGDTGTLPASAPLDATTCSSLDAKWVNFNDKAVKCINATYDPKLSALSQNCTSVNQQFDPYYAQIQALVPSGTDPANRAGELGQRIDVIRHVFYDQFLSAVQAKIASQ
jgi:hypothetical protein